MTSKSASAPPPPRGPGSVAVIGAGPAGLMAAEIIAAAGHRVDIYEAMPSPARKFLMAGRGGLNLTHSQPLAEFVGRYEDQGGSIRHAVETFPPQALIEWANALGIETFIGSSGRIFPKSMKASPLLRAWLHRLNGLSVTLHTRMRWLGWDDGHGLIFDNETPGGGRTVRSADAVILALGGASWPRLGSDGAWVKVLAENGIAVSPLRPFNAGVVIAWSKPLGDKFHGSPLKRIAVSCGDHSARGEAVITRSGLEGGAIYAINAAILHALECQEPATITIDLRPDLPADLLAQRLSIPRGRQSLSNFLRKSAGLSPAAIAIAREPSNGRLPHDAAELAAAIKAVRLPIQDIGQIATAISTAGGVPARELDAHAMLIARPGTFVAGEMLDWAAPTGGYLLQATFASAVRAANGALNWLADGGSRR